MVAECGTPASTCFCTSMDTGPSADAGFDLALTELDDAGGHRFMVRVGSARGAEVLSSVASEPASRADHEGRARGARRRRKGHRSPARHRRSRRPAGPQPRAPALGQRWRSAAWPAATAPSSARPASAATCETPPICPERSGGSGRGRPASTSSIPTCMGGTSGRATSSRYRQWLTHKLSTWWDQFGTSGCVGCGRCIAWCPVGIDLTEEAAAIRATDGAPAWCAPRPEAGMTTSIAELVAEHPLLAGLPGDAVAQVAGCARNVAFAPGPLLLAEGDPADTLYLVRRGRVAIEVHAPGRGPIIIETVGPGAVGRVELALPAVPLALRRPGGRSRGGDRRRRRVPAGQGGGRPGVRLRVAATSGGRLARAPPGGAGATPRSLRAEAVPLIRSAAAGGRRPRARARARALGHDTGPVSGGRRRNARRRT